LKKIKTLRLPLQHARWLAVLLLCSDVMYRQCQGIPPPRHSTVKGTSNKIAI